MFLKCRNGLKTWHIGNPNTTAWFCNHNILHTNIMRSYSLVDWWGILTPYMCLDCNNNFRSKEAILVGVMAIAGMKGEFLCGQRRIPIIIQHAMKSRFHCATAEELAFAWPMVVFSNHNKKLQQTAKNTFGPRTHKCPWWFFHQNSN